MATLRSYESRIIDYNFINVLLSGLDVELRFSTSSQFDGISIIIKKEEGIKIAKQLILLFSINLSDLYC